MQMSIRRIFQALATPTPVFVATAVVSLMSTGCQSPDVVLFGRADLAEGAYHPILPDAALIASFHEHRSTFEQLRQMIETDSKLHRVREDRTDPKDPAEAGVSPERNAEYRRLLRVIGCPAGLVASPRRHEIYFDSGHYNLLIAAAKKGYCYLKNPPPSTVTSTSELRVGDDEQVFRHIEGHWYIYWFGF